MPEAWKVLDSISNAQVEDGALLCVYSASATVSDIWQWHDGRTNAGRDESGALVVDGN